MRKINIFKSLRTLVFALVGLVLAGGIFFACQNHNDDAPEGDALLQEGVEYPIPENARVEVSDVRFAKDVTENFIDQLGTAGDMLSIETANALYYLPRDIKHHAAYAKLLKGDGSRFNIVKYTVGHYNQEYGAFPLIKVEVPSKEEKEWELKWLEKAYRSLEEGSVDQTSRAASATTMTLQQAQQFFNQFKNMRCDWILQNPCLPFQYAKDGCYARAHYMKKLMEEAGYSSQKIFAYVNVYNSRPVLDAYTKANCCIEWNWHVAPIVGVSTGYSTQQMVIDPSLCDGPVSISTWISAMKSNCFGYGVANVQYSIRPASSYIRTRYGTYTTDDDYSKTYQTLSNYSTLSGCN